MIDISALPVFLAAVAALLLVPGPDFVLISSLSMTRGLRYGAAPWESPRGRALARLPAK